MADAFVDAVSRPQEKIAFLKSLTDPVWDALTPFIVAGVILPTGVYRTVRLEYQPNANDTDLPFVPRITSVFVCARSIGTCCCHS